MPRGLTSAGAAENPTARDGVSVTMLSVQDWLRHQGLGPFLDAVRKDAGGYDVIDHWQQGEFHHDLVLRLPASVKLPGNVLVIATNCNAGIKEVLFFAEVPERWAL